MGAGRPSFRSAVRCGARRHRYTRVMREPVEAPAKAATRSVAGQPVAAWTLLASPFGPLHVAATAEGICGIELRTTDEAFTASVAHRIRGSIVRSGEAPRSARAVLDAARAELKAYADGARTGFALPLDLRGCSDWDRRVLAGVRTIPFGTTASYGEVARRVGAAGAARAVGGAVGRNPVGLVIPCHRVIAGDGTLGGYGGSWFGSREELLALKRLLLAHEGVAIPPSAPGALPGRPAYRASRSPAGCAEQRDGRARSPS